MEIYLLKMISKNNFNGFGLKHMNFQIELLGKCHLVLPIYRYLIYVDCLQCQHNQLTCYVVICRKFI